MGKSRRKKGGNLNRELQMDKNGLNLLESNPRVETENENENENSMDNSLKNAFSKNKEGGENENNENNENKKNKNKEGAENMTLEINEKSKEGGENINNENNNDLSTNAKKAVQSGIELFNGALSGLTSNKNKIGGSNALQGKLFSVINNRSIKLKNELENLATDQNNVRKRTDSALNEVKGLLNQFTQYKKMGGGKKTRRRRKKHKTRRQKKKRHRRSKH